MSQYYDNSYRPFRSGAAISKYARVKVHTDGTVITAGLAEKEIGTATNETFASGELVSVKLRTAAGSHKMICSEAVDVGDIVYTETSGKIQDTAQATSFIVGTALEAGSGDGSVIEVVYNVHGDTANS